MNDAEGDPLMDDCDTLADPPISKKLGPPVVVLEHVKKRKIAFAGCTCFVVSTHGFCTDYTLPGRDDPVRALDGVSLSHSTEYYPVRRGEFVMLRGPSGGGKTTMLNIIGTIDRATEGHVKILGTTIDSSCTDDFLASTRLEKIGFVFQTFNLLATMSAFENVELPMTILGKLNRKERKQKARELLRMVGLRDRETHLPSELSGGEQQRVTIARSLANDPAVLLLGKWKWPWNCFIVESCNFVQTDEPTGDLDTRNTVLIMDLLLKVCYLYPLLCFQFIFINCCHRLTRNLVSR
jgi:putative ABC transport system ATP-binding protein